MKAAIINQWGDLSQIAIQDIPSPPLGEGQVRVGVRAACANFADTLMVAGQYQVRPELPFSPGFEAAGEIIEVGQGVTRIKPGDRVMAIYWNGAFAEEMIAPAHQVMRIPDEMDFTTAAAFPIAYGTAHISLDHRARLQPGEMLLVHGAAGGVGLAAVEVGKLLGAEVIATASTPEKLTLAAEYGATHTINYTEEPFHRQVRKLTNGNGANVIFDPVGGEVFENSLRCIAWEGRLLVIGFASGDIPNVAVGRLLVRNFSLVGAYWGGYMNQNPQVIHDSMDVLLGWWSEGKLKPLVSATYALDDVVEALQALLDRKVTGRVVILP